MASLRIPLNLVRLKTGFSGLTKIAGSSKQAFKSRNQKLLKSHVIAPVRIFFEPKRIETTQEMDYPDSKIAQEPNQASETPFSTLSKKPGFATFLVLDASIQVSIQIPQFVRELLRSHPIDRGH